MLIGGRARLESEAFPTVCVAKEIQKFPVSIQQHGRRGISENRFSLHGWRRDKKTRACKHLDAYRNREVVGTTLRISLSNLFRLHHSSRQSASGRGQLVRLDRNSKHACVRASPSSLPPPPTQLRVPTVLEGSEIFRQDIIVSWVLPSQSVDVIYQKQHATNFFESKILYYNILSIQKKHVRIQRLIVVVVVLCVNTGTLCTMDTTM
jgi:hypothetical protein